MVGQAWEHVDARSGDAVCVLARQKWAAAQLEHLQDA